MCLAAAAAAAGSNRPVVLQAVAVAAAAARRRTCADQARARAAHRRWSPTFARACACAVPPRRRSARRTARRRTASAKVPTASASAWRGDQEARTCLAFARVCPRLHANAHTRQLAATSTTSMFSSLTRYARTRAHARAVCTFAHSRPSACARARLRSLGACGGRARVSAKATVQQPRRRAARVRACAQRSPLSARCSDGAAGDANVSSASLRSVCIIVVGRRCCRRVRARNLSSGARRRANASLHASRARADVRLRSDSGVRSDTVAIAAAAAAVGGVCERARAALTLLAYARVTDGACR